MPNVRRRRLCQQGAPRMVIERHPLLRGFCLAADNNLIQDGTLKVRIHLFQVEVLPTGLRQFCSAQATGHIEKHPHRLSQTQFPNDTLVLPSSVRESLS